MNAVSFWEDQTFFAPRDVIIAGSGLVGLWSAYLLQKKHPKLRVAIIDRGIIPTGASTRNAGFACFGSLSEIVSDIRLIGLDKMLELVELRYKGLKVIQKHFSDELIDFELCGGYELYDSTDDLFLEEELAYVNSIIKPITKLKKTYRQKDDLLPRFGFTRTAHLVYNKLEGYLHSGKLVLGLLQKVQGMGVQIISGIEATHWEEAAGRIVVHNKQGIPLQADQLLICTNAFSKQLLPHIDIVPARGQVIVTSPIQNLPFKGTFHSDEGYYYFRNLGDRVLLGGARNKAFTEEQTEIMETSDTIQQHLEKYLSEVVLPYHQNGYTIDYRWSGIMGMGSHKIPLLQQVAPQVFCAIRMSGMGVALAPVAADKVIKLMGR